MENAENVLPPSKKRAAGRELSRDNPGLDDDDETTVQETGTFKKASDEVMANRRIVKVRRHATSSAPAPSTNPFAGIRLVPPTTPLVSTDKTEGVKLDKVEEKHDVSVDSVEVKGDGVFPVSSGLNGNKEFEAVKDDASKDAETEKVEVDKVIDVAKDEVNKESEEVKGEVNKEVGVVKSDLDKEAEWGKTQSENQTKDPDRVDSTVHKNSAEIVSEKLESDEKSEGKNESRKDTEGEKTENEDEKANAGIPFSSFQQLSSTPNAFTGFAGTGFSGSTFSFGSISKEAKLDQPSFGVGAPSNNNGNNSLFGGSGFPSMQERSIETGEENEDAVFAADSALFEFIGGWRERGKGEVKVNVSTDESRKARLVMRSRGNCRLILNANLFPEMKLTNMDKKGITFACINSACETKDKLVTYALKFKDTSVLEEFRAAVMEHKGCPASTLKTPENSPDASEV
ncbi:unnamed protein product [Cuscuta campestris]|uniref:RanBD1 domain-containing protein n=1 Tax=Cuscuta campestris TaxID=132261 RepID=A0A484M753_9ASTE|nr:unnamed protein product [Cuscuta campestris]